MLHYIPIDETIKSLYNHQNQYINFKTAGKDQTLHDISDGSVYTPNTSEHTGDKLFEIILYEDSFQVVNPLDQLKETN